MNSAFWEWLQACFQGLGLSYCATGQDQRPQSSSMARGTDSGRMRHSLQAVVEVFPFVALDMAEALFLPIVEDPVAFPVHLAPLAH
jgi:hypothetical protein